MSATTERTYLVDGMSCGHCRATITDAVQRVSGVGGVEVDLDRGTVTVCGAGVSDDAVRTAIDDAGYEVRP